MDCDKFEEIFKPITNASNIFKGQFRPELLGGPKCAPDPENESDVDVETLEEFKTEEGPSQSDRAKCSDVDVWKGDHQGEGSKGTKVAKNDKQAAKEDCEANDCEQLKERSAVVRDMVLAVNPSKKVSKGCMFRPARKFASITEIVDSAGRSGRGQEDSGKTKRKRIPQKHSEQVSPSENLISFSRPQTPPHGQGFR